MYALVVWVHFSSLCFKQEINCQITVNHFNYSSKMNSYYLQKKILEKNNQKEANKP